MKQRLASPTHLVDLAKVEGLVGIARTPDAITIRAMTTHAMVADLGRDRGGDPRLE